MVVGYSCEFDLAGICEDGDDCCCEYHLLPPRPDNLIMVMVVPPFDRRMEICSDERAHRRAGGYHGGMCVSSERCQFVHDGAGCDRGWGGD